MYEYTIEFKYGGTKCKITTYTHTVNIFDISKVLKRVLVLRLLETLCITISLSNILQNRTFKITQILNTREIYNKL
jgi:hypothetical protein